MQECAKEGVCKNFMKYLCKMAVLSWFFREKKAKIELNFSYAYAKTQKFIVKKIVNLLLKLYPF